MVLRHTEAKVTVQRNKKAKSMKGKGTGKGTRPAGKKNIKGILVGGAASTGLQILSCDSTSVTIQGNESANVTKGSFLINVGEIGEVESCFNCAPLFRKVISASSASTGTTTLRTKFVTMGELFDNTVLDQAFKSQLIEPLAGCSHSGVTSGTKFTNGEDSAESQLITFEGNRPSAPPSQALVSAAAAGSNCDPLWQRTNSDGRCTHTDCFVGLTGDPVNCFVCKSTCNNGCGAKGSFLNVNGNFIAFDFGPACCNHDYCWSSSSNPKAQCDSSFYGQMRSQCDPFSSKPIPFVKRLGLVIIPAAFHACHTLALAFYLAVRSSIGQNAYETAQDEQIEYNSGDECTAKCPTTQESGGQGVTTLTINLLKTSGTFQVKYEMYTIPDELTVQYEGKTIFSTGGLVSGASTASVSFAGTSTKIQVIINAPNAGTAWDVFVGCP